MANTDHLSLGKQRAFDMRLPHEQVVMEPSREVLKYYTRETIWALLGAGAEAYSCYKEDANPTGTGGFNSSERWYKSDRGFSSTHSALLIGIKPLKEESAERKLLREFIENKWSDRDLCARAKALLEGG